MPTLLEGDLPTTLTQVRFNLKYMLATLRNGYKLVCSCPTCGFLMKMLLKEGAFHSHAYQQSVNAGENEIVVPGSKAGHRGLVRLKKSIYRKILTDDSCFSSLDPLERIALSEYILDLGFFLSCLPRNDCPDIRFHELRARMVYYEPCHQRKQGTGSPYMVLLAMIPGADG